MKTLHVLYDHTCGLCCRAVHRLSIEPTYIPLKFLPSASVEALDRFGAVLKPGKPDQVIVIANSGEVYRGSSAWLMVLYALRRYRGLSIALSRPGWRPLVDRAINVISRRRTAISEAFGCRPDFDVLARTRQAAPVSACANGSCGVAFEPYHNAEHPLRAAKERADASMAAP